MRRVSIEPPLVPGSLDNGEFVRIPGRDRPLAADYSPSIAKIAFYDGCLILVNLFQIVCIGIGSKPFTDVIFKRHVTRRLACKYPMRNGS